MGSKEEEKCAKRMQEIRKATPANNKCFVCLVQVSVSVMQHTLHCLYACPAPA